MEKVFEISEISAYLQSKTSLFLARNATPSNFWTKYCLLFFHGARHHYLIQAARKPFRFSDTLQKIFLTFVKKFLKAKHTRFLPVKPVLCFFDLAWIGIIGSDNLSLREPLHEERGQALENSDISVDKKQYNFPQAQFRGGYISKMWMFITPELPTRKVTGFCLYWVRCFWSAEERWGGKLVFLPTDWVR